MELVYLWVEDYKNIKNQGFNFSPRFRCEYDKDKNELTIKENEDYIPDFFGENINVTAIVGKNGSGKSSVLKLILMLIYYQKFINLNRGDKFIESENFDRVNYNKKRRIERIFQNKKIFLIMYINETFEKILINSNIQSKIPIRYLNALSFYTLHFNYMLDTLYDGSNDAWIKEIYHKADSYDIPLLLEPYKNNNYKQFIDLELIEYLNNQNMLRFYSKLKLEENNIFNFFKPDKINIKMKKVINQFMFTIESKFGDEETISYLNKYGIGKEVKFLIYKYFIVKQRLYNILSDEDLLIASKIDNFYNNNMYKELNKIYIALKVLDSDKSLFDSEVYKNIESWFLNINKKIKIDFKFKNLIKDSSPIYEIRKIKLCLEFEDNKIYDKDEFKKCINSNNEINVINNILKFIPPWMEVEWFEDTKSIKSLSSGEKTFLTFIINLMYQIENINDRYEYTTINLFLDESELGFHPQWQKKYLLKIIEAIKKVNRKKVNLLFATHSPFILSDIPKQNIIFLDTYEKGKCKVVDGLKEKKQTFGANIHTLLSDSFFMENGLMGEFAKGKIDEVIKYLNGKKDTDIKNDDEAQKLVNIIGEPIIKNQLQRMLDSKRLKKVDEIDAIKKSMEEMQKRLDELEK